MSLVVSSKQPNVIIVFIDDMGWGDFSCFGNKEANTPHIDALAEEGVRFHNFYANSPICSPSRVALTTGNFPARYKITSFINDRKGNAARGMVDWLPSDTPTLPRILKEAGYYTGHFGKWHMGGGRDVNDAPYITEYGFDDYLTNFEGMGKKVLGLCQKPGEEPSKKYFKMGEYVGKPFTWVPRHQVTTEFVKAAISHISSAQKQGKPFYLNLWPDDVHAPFYPSLERWDENVKKRYMICLEEMDAQLGLLFEFVKESPELKNNTLILVTNDNGPSAGLHSQMPFRGWKTYVYEGGIRVPLVVWGPSLINRKSHGTINKTSVFSAVDLVPSLIKVCEAELPAGISFDGEELSQTLRGYSQNSREKPLFFNRPPDDVFKEVYGLKGAPELAVRQGRWKVLCDKDGTNLQLYDLESDPMENQNLKKTNEQKAQELRRVLLEWWKTVAP